MRFMSALGVGLTVALLASVAYAQREDNPKVTGGGQIDVSTSGGAGNTLTFYGEEATGGDRGQVQYVGTADAGPGGVADLWHGFVDCVNIEGADPDGDGFGGRARLSGDTSDGETFWLEVIDPDAGGPGGDGADPIRLHKPTDSDCDEENDDARDTELGRGEAVIHNPAG